MLGIIKLRPSISTLLLNKILLSLTNYTFSIIFADIFQEILVEIEFLMNACVAINNIINNVHTL